MNTHTHTRRYCTIYSTVFLSKMKSNAIMIAVMIHLHFSVQGKIFKQSVARYRLHANIMYAKISLISSLVKISTLQFRPKPERETHLTYIQSIFKHFSCTIGVDESIKEI